MCKYNPVIGKVFDMYSMINEQVYQVKHLINRCQNMTASRRFVINETNVLSWGKLTLKSSYVNYGLLCPRYRIIANLDKT